MHKKARYYRAFLCWVSTQSLTKETLQPCLPTGRLSTFSLIIPASLCHSDEGGISLPFIPDLTRNLSFQLIN